MAVDTGILENSDGPGQLAQTVAEKSTAKGERLVTDKSNKDILTDMAADIRRLTVYMYLLLTQVHEYESDDLDVPEELT